MKSILSPETIVVVEAEKQDSVCFELYFNKQQKETTY